MKLLEEVRQVARLRRLALETERCYARWIEQYIRFHKTAAGFRHPNAMGADEVEGFLTFLAVQGCGNTERTTEALRTQRKKHREDELWLPRRYR